MNYYVLKGAMHIHTTFSDGTSDVDEISKYAKKLGLDWILITDHNTMQVKEGIYNGVIVITGEEITPEQANHYLAIDIKNVIMPDDNPQIYIDEVRKQNGFGFMAHPDEFDHRKNKAKPLKWTDRSIIGDGIELWNWFSSWANNLNDHSVFHLAYGYFFRHRLVKGAEMPTIKWWDEINNSTEDIFPASAGIDAHALNIRKYIIPLKVFSYPVMLNTLHNNICLHNPPGETFEEKRMQIINALKSGNNIILNRHVFKEIPEIYMENNRCSVFAGESINLDNNTYLYVNTVKNALIKLYLNGELIEKSHNSFLKFKINSKGKYRTEIYYKNHPWVYSNPIAVV